MPRLLLALILLAAAPAQSQAPERPKETVVPGGLNALAFVAGAKENSPPERFFLDYSRALVHRASSNNEGKAYLERLLQYFQRIATLQGFGRRDGAGVKITLSVNDEHAQRRTEKVVNFLGWKTYSFQKRLRLEVAEKTTQGRRKETSSALAIDEIAMQEALQNGRSFTFDLPYEKAAVLPPFDPREDLPGGFAEALVREPRLAKAYVALSALDAPTASALLAAADLSKLTAIYADLVALHGSALGVVNGRATLPGGDAAEPVWSRLAGADARRPAEFFRALLEKDQGKLMAFFSTISRLDAAHQRFATGDFSRTRALYELFRQPPASQGPTAMLMRETPLIEFLQHAPLDGQGRLRFPGRPAFGEKEVLALLGRLHKPGGKERGEFDAVLAVARMEAQRGRPLDEVPARLLVDRHAELAPAYPYFVALTGITVREFAAFFDLADKLRDRDRVGLNIRMGQFHALAELLSLAQSSGALTEQRTAELFRLLCERFTKAASPADLTIASLDLVKTMLAEPPDADEAIRNMLLGHEPPARVELNGAAREIDTAAVRHADYRQVLELQKVPSLQVLLTLYEAARKLAGTESIAALEAAAATLPVVEIPKTFRPKGSQKANLLRQDPGNLLNRIEQLRRDAAKGALHQDDRETFSRDLLAEINPQVKLALTGIVYAYYLHPDDLLVEEDPLLLRKHQFSNLAAIHVGPKAFPATTLQTGDGIGSYLIGGFADFGPLAGHVALAGSKQSETNSEAVFAAQVGLLRSAEWKRLRDDELRQAAGRIQAGREWVTAAAERSESRAELAAATIGVLPLSRRAQLLNGLARQDMTAVSSAVTLGDLYRLGSLRLPASRTPFSRLPSVSPYEEYERYLMSSRMADRLAELSFYLAEYMDRRAWPAAVWPAIAEPVAKELLRELPMSDPYDWRSVLAAFSAVDDKLIERVLGEP